MDTRTRRTATTGDPRPILAALLMLVAAPAPAAGAPAGALGERVRDAQELLDTYYGDRSHLTQAAKLVGSVLVEDERFAPAYVQLARIILMGGHIANWEFDGGTRESARKALDRAVELDPDYPESYVLLGHVDALSRKKESARRNLEKAIALGSTNPWVDYNLGDAAYLTRSYAEADEHYKRVVERGPGEDAQQRRAYVAALSQRMRIAYKQSDVERLQRMAAKATEAAPPEDAWTWGDASGLLCYVGRLDRGIEYGKKAVSIMSYGVGRYNLAFCMYGKSALLVRKGDAEQARTLFDEARRIYPNVREVAEDFSGTAISPLAGTLLELAQSR